MVPLPRLRYCLLPALLLLTACDGGDALSDIEDAGRLVVASRNSPTTFYRNKGEDAGFELELSQGLADELGVALDMQTHHKLTDIFQSLRREQVSFAAAGLSTTPGRQAEFQFSRSYFSVSAQVIYKAGKKKPRRVQDLIGERLVAIADSSHTELLKRLQLEHPALEWDELEGVEPLDLMAMVAEESARFAIVDSNEFDAHRRFHPRLSSGLVLAQEEQLAWIFPAGARYKRLLQRANQYLEAFERDGRLAALKAKYFTGEAGLSPTGVHTFNTNMRVRLPEYEPLIRRVAQEYQLDWHLLAAIAYQESHWDARATSPTGVRGLMMITRRTASEMGVSNRLDPTQSLRGGVRYLKQLKRKLPADIAEPDRGWFALAAYNIGRGHLEDARVITERQGGDPHIWEDVAQRLPLLQKSEHYRNARHGYARGSEPVSYVSNIRHYQKILAWRDISQKRALPAIITGDMLPEVLQNSRLSAL